MCAENILSVIVIRDVHTLLRDSDVNAVFVLILSIAVCVCVCVCMCVCVCVLSVC